MMKYTKEQAEKIHKVMHEFKHGKLKSCSKQGKEVTDRDQAIAIAMSEAGIKKAVSMSDAEFLKEHEHLIKVLRSGSDKQRKAEADAQSNEMKQELAKSFDALNLDQFVESINVKTRLEKSFQALETAQSFETLHKAFDTSGLVKKKVQIHGSNGKVYEGYRWVSTATGQPASTGKESKETAQFKEQKGKEASAAKPKQKEKVEQKQDVDFANKIKEIAETSGSKSSRLKDLAGLGVYDPGLLMQLSPDFNMADVTHYLKQSGIDYKKFQDSVMDNINIGLGNKPIDKDAPIHQLQQEVKNKDLQKILKVKKEERAKQLGISAKDKFDAYAFKLDQLIGDRMTRSLIVYGTGGIGKSFTLQQKLNEYGKVGYDPELDLQASEYDYVTITGSTSPTDLYNTMFNNPKKLLIFDDCDSMWENEDMANILKGALDTTGNNMIHYANPKKLEDGTYPPKTFKFSGQCIFISNLPRDKFYAPLVDSRSNALDLTMNMEQTLEKLDDIKYKFKYKDADGKELEIPKTDRDDIIKVLHELSNDLRVEQLNGRVLGNLAALKLGLTKRGHKSYDEFKKQAMIALDLV